MSLTGVDQGAQDRGRNRGRRCSRDRAFRTDAYHRSKRLRGADPRSQNVRCQRKRLPTTPTGPHLPPYRKLYAASGMGR